MKVIEINPPETYSEGFNIKPLKIISPYEHHVITDDILTDQEIEERIFFQNTRNKFWAQDSLELQKQRMRLLDSLAVYNFDPPIFVNEMYLTPNKILKSQLEIYNLFDIHFNTRTISPGELQLDIDVGDQILAQEIISKTCLNLLNDNKHFSVFYSEGQRAPQIRIYFVKELAKQTKITRKIIRSLFWKKYVPNKYWSCVDQTMFNDGKTCQLEFSPHWKTGTTFNLLFEYVPDTGTIQKQKEVQLKL